jgi:hypothetical protein
MFSRCRGTVSDICGVHCVPIRGRPRIRTFTIVPASIRISKLRVKRCSAEAYVHFSLFDVFRRANTFFAYDKNRWMHRKAVPGFIRPLIHDVASTIRRPLLANQLGIANHNPLLHITMCAMSGQYLRVQSSQSGKDFRPAVNMLPAKPM